MTGLSIPDRIKRILGQHLDPDSAAPQVELPRQIRRGTDKDGVDEAWAMLKLLGGDVWAGDVVEVETSDPTFWNAKTFELTYRIEAACLADLRDTSGAFTFNIFFLAPDQGADVLIIEGDLPETARAYLGTRGPDALTNELRRYRDDYKRNPAAEVRYSIATDGLGEWSAFRAGENGRFWLRHGSSRLVPSAAQNPDGTAYRDCSFYYGDALGAQTWELRLMEIGGFGHAFQCEVLTLNKLKFWRRDRPANAKR